MARDLTPEPEPAVRPDAIPSVNAGAVTTLQAGNEDGAPTNVTQISGGAGMTQGTQGSSSLWKWKQPGAFLEYSVRATAAATYAVSVVYFAAQGGGTANVFVDGMNVGDVAFASTKDAGGYGGIPGCCSRAPGVAANLAVGVHKIRVAFTARSTPVDVQMIQVNHSGAQLAEAGKVHLVASSGSTMIAPETAADFYRNNYSRTSRMWPCGKSFSLVGFRLDVEKAGAYEISMPYRTIDAQCAGLGIVVDAKPQAAFKLNPGSGVTPPTTIQLPAGPARLTLRNPNYVGGQFCGFGALFGQIVLKPLP